MRKRCKSHFLKWLPEIPEFGSDDLNKNLLIIWDPPNLSQFAFCGLRLKCCVIFFWSDICTRKVKQSIKALSLVIHLPDRRSQSCKTVMMIVKVILILSLATLSMARCRGIRCVFKSEETRWKTPLILTTIVIVFAVIVTILSWW